MQAEKRGTHFDSTAEHADTQNCCDPNPICREKERTVLFQNVFSFLHSGHFTIFYLRIAETSLLCSLLIPLAVLERRT